MCTGSRAYEINGKKTTYMCTHNIRGVGADWKVWGGTFRGRSEGGKGKL